MHFDCIPPRNVNYLMLHMSHVTRKPVFAICEQQHQDQPVHARSLISVFVIRCLDSIIPLLAYPKFQDSS